MSNRPPSPVQRPRSPPRPRSPTTSTFQIRGLPPSTSSAEAGFVTVSSSEYDQLIQEHPEAVLCYIDEEDEEVIRVGSGTELRSRWLEVMAFPPPPPPIIFNVEGGATGLNHWKLIFEKSQPKPEEQNQPKPEQPKPTPQPVARAEESDEEESLYAEPLGKKSVPAVPPKEPILPESISTPAASRTPVPHLNTSLPIEIAQEPIVASFEAEINRIYEEVLSQAGGGSPRCLSPRPMSPSPRDILSEQPAPPADAEDEAARNPVDMISDVFKTVIQSIQRVAQEATTQAAKAFPQTPTGEAQEGGRTPAESLDAFNTAVQQLLKNFTDQLHALATEAVQSASNPQANPQHPAAVFISFAESVGHAAVQNARNISEELRDRGSDASAEARKAADELKKAAEEVKKAAQLVTREVGKTGMAVGSFAEGAGREVGKAAQLVTREVGKTGLAVGSFAGGAGREVGKVIGNGAGIVSGFAEGLVRNLSGQSQPSPADNAPEVVVEPRTTQVEEAKEVTASEIIPPVPSGSQSSPELPGTFPDSPEVANLPPPPPPHGHPMPPPPHGHYLPPPPPPPHGHPMPPPSNHHMPPPPPPPPPHGHHMPPPPPPHGHPMPPPPNGQPMPLPPPPHGQPMHPPHQGPPMPLPHHHGKHMPPPPFPPHHGHFFPPPPPHYLHPRPPPGFSHPSHAPEFPVFPPFPPPSHPARPLPIQYHPVDMHLLHPPAHPPSRHSWMGPTPSYGSFEWSEVPSDDLNVTSFVSSGSNIKFFGSGGDSISNISDPSRGIKEEPMTSGPSREKKMKEFEGPESSSDSERDYRIRKGPFRHRGTRENARWRRRRRSQESDQSDSQSNMEKSWRHSFPRKSPPKAVDSPFENPWLPSFRPVVQDNVFPDFKPMPPRRPFHGFPHQFPPPPLQFFPPLPSLPTVPAPTAPDAVNSLPPIASVVPGLPQRTNRRHSSYFPHNEISIMSESESEDDWKDTNEKMDMAPGVSLPESVNLVDLESSVSTIRTKSPIPEPRMEPVPQFHYPGLRRSKTTTDASKNQPWLAPWQQTRGTEQVDEDRSEAMKRFPSISELQSVWATSTAPPPPPPLIQEQQVPQASVNNSPFDDLVSLASALPTAYSPVPKPNYTSRTSNPFSVPEQTNSAENLPGSRPFTPAPTAPLVDTSEVSSTSTEPRPNSRNPFLAHPVDTTFTTPTNYDFPPLPGNLHRATSMSAGTRSRQSSTSTVRFAQPLFPRHAQTVLDRSTRNRPSSPFNAMPGYFPEEPQAEIRNLQTSQSAIDEALAREHERMRLIQQVEESVRRSSEEFDEQQRINAAVANYSTDNTRTVRFEEDPIEKCVKSLIELGYTELGTDRLRVFAELSGGQVEDAVDMVEEERNIWQNFASS